MERCISFSSRRRFNVHWRSKGGKEAAAKVLSKKDDDNKFSITRGYFLGSLRFCQVFKVVLQMADVTFVVFAWTSRWILSSRYVKV